MSGFYSEFGGDLPYLAQIPEPEFRNSPGRLLAVLDYVLDDLGNDHTRPHHNLASYGRRLTRIVSGNRPDTAIDESRALIVMLRLIVTLYEKSLDDIKQSALGDSTKALMIDTLRQLKPIAYPSVKLLLSSPESFYPGERQTLRIAASMLPQEHELTADSIKKLNKAVEAFVKAIESDKALPDNVRRKLLELAELARRTLQFHRLRGADAFEEGFTRWVGEMWLIQVQNGEEKVRRWSLWKPFVEVIRCVIIVIKLMVPNHPHLPEPIGPDQPDTIHLPRFENLETEELKVPDDTPENPETDDIRED